MQTKSISIISGSILVLAAGLIMIGCDVQLPEAPEPELLQSNSGFPNKRPSNESMVVKHIMLYNQGVTFDLLDSSSTWDATGVVVSGGIAKVINDKLTVEKRTEKLSIEAFLAKTAEKSAPKGCKYIINTRNGIDNYKIHELSLNAGCKNNTNTPKEMVFIFNADIPEKIIKIEKNSNKYGGPRCDTARSKIRYESLTYI